MSAEHPPRESANGNGAGQEGKRADEAAEEAMRKIAPAIRSDAYFDKDLTPGAKFFYGALVDLQFLDNRGGNRRGKIFTSLKELSRLYKHNRETIRAWRDELCGSRWLWVKDRWPYSEWRITAMCPPPEDWQETNPAQKLIAKAASQGVAEDPPPHFSDISGGGGGSSATQSLEIRHPKPEVPPLEGGSSATQSGNLRPYEAEVSASGGGNSASPAGSSAVAGRFFRHALDDVPSGGGGSSDTIEETPSRTGSSGESLNAVSNRLDNRAGGGGVERPATPAKAKRRPTQDENDFLALCREVMGKPEMDGPLKNKPKGNGGLWRNFYRINAKKAWAVIRETREVKINRPSTLKTTWARFAMDLWKFDRLNHNSKEAAR